MPDRSRRTHELFAGSGPEFRAGKSALDFLCHRGCDRAILESLLVFLTHPTPLRLEAGLERKQPIEIHLRPLDALKTTDALGTDMRRLRQIASRASKLGSEIIRLRKTPLVRHLDAEGKFFQGDLLSTSPVLNHLGGLSQPTGLQGLIDLPRLAKKLGSERSPERTRLLKKIYAHIRERTGHWYDGRVADVLNAFDLPYLEPSLKEWRKRHGLTR
jgi:hypothetical protein